MAELILTDEEKAAPSYFDLDDASLGRATKYVASVIADHYHKDDNGHGRVMVSSAGLLLVSTALDANATELSLKFGGHTSYGVETGDWEIIVRRTKAPPPREDLPHARTSSGFAT